MRRSLFLCSNSIGSQPSISPKRGWWRQGDDVGVLALSGAWMTMCWHCRREKGGDEEDGNDDDAVVRMKKKEFRGSEFHGSPREERR